MLIFIQGSALHTLEVQDETVSSLKAYVEKVEGISAVDQVLYHAGVPLNEDQLVLNCVPDNGTIDVCARLKGGKVHGSLARAGKVKGQTPKVEKQEKRKKKTGRAKRRMQFNRRFVNVVATFGKKKGPNSNS